jgi:hypothetical protein
VAAADEAQAAAGALAAAATALGGGGKIQARDGVFMAVQLGYPLPSRSLVEGHLVVRRRYSDQVPTGCGG